MALYRISTAKTKNLFISAFTRWAHTVAQPPQIHTTIPQSPLVLPESQNRPDPVFNGFGSGFYVGSGSMDLMAVPKKKTSPHKRGIRNGPKALKPIPVIIRCKACGQVKLPHFYCCSGIRDTNGPNGSTN